MSGMKELLKGVVRDHRLPCDYHHFANQPWNTMAFLKNFKRFIVHRHMTKQNVTIPMYAVLVRNTHSFL